MKGGAMKIQHGLLIAGSLLLAAGCSNAAAAPAPAETAQADTAAVETEVRNFIEQYNADYGANDLDKYFTSFEPDLTQEWPSGRVDLQTYETRPEEHTSELQSPMPLSYAVFCFK